MLTEEVTKRKLLSALCHGSIFFSGLIVSAGIPIAILFIVDDDITKENAREALNFHFNIWLWGAIITFLCWLLIGFLFLPIFLLLTWILPIIAIIKVFGEPYEPYKYPFIFRLL